MTYVVTILYGWKRSLIAAAIDTTDSRFPWQCGEGWMYIYKNLKVRQCNNEHEV